MMKTIGLIGGMSWESTRIYYDLLNRGVQRRLGGLHSARMLLSSLDLAEIALMQTEGRWDEAGDLMAIEAVRLETAGARVIALATNTMHKCAAHITSAIGVPFLHIADPLISALRADHRHRPVLLATRFTMEDRFFVERLETAGFEPVLPRPADRRVLHAIIFDELCQGIISESALSTSRRLIADAVSRGADSVILGCTELDMLIPSESAASPVYDTAMLHAAALVDFSLASA
jgi:aspartate racemase